MLRFSERTFCASPSPHRFPGCLGGASRVRSEELDTARVPCQHVPHGSLADEWFEPSQGDTLWSATGTIAPGKRRPERRRQGVSVAETSRGYQ